MNKQFLPDNTARPGDFIAMAACLMRAHGSPMTAATMAEDRHATSPRIARVLKDAISAATLADATWAGNLVDYRIIANGFLDSLRSISVFDRLVGDNAFVRVPLRTRVGSVTIGASGYVSVPGAMRPISRITLAANSNLEPVKADAIIVVTEEVILNGGAAGSALLSRELRGAVAAVTDATFLAGLAASVTPTVSSGDDTQAVLADLMALMTAVAPRAGSRLYFVLPPDIATALSLMYSAGGFLFPGMSALGGTMLNLPALVSDQVPADTVLLIDASRIAADSDVIVLDASSQTSLQMNDSPVEGATNLVSLFQTNSRALKASRYFGFEPMRDNALAVLTDVQWGGSSSGT